MARRFDTWILAGLTVITTILAVVMACLEMASWLEAASFVTGAICVWLTVKESVWNFPISLVNVSTFSVVFFRAQLFADASLQAIYFALTIIGWYLWLYGGARHTALRIGRAGWGEGIGVLLAVGLITLAYWHVLLHIAGATSLPDAVARMATVDWGMLQNTGRSPSFWDALTTAICLGAQWLLNRKRLETWILWIAADVMYVPLYIYKGLYLTAILYVVFLVMAFMGLRQWHATFRRQKEEPQGFPVLPPVETAA